MTLSSCSATASIRSCRNSRRASGSRLATGSSRISSSGRLARPSVSASCARWPPESLRACCVAVEAEPLDPVAAPARRPSPGSAARRGAGARRRSGPRRSACPARRSRPSASCPGSARPPPSTSIVPAVGASIPTARFSSVLLPAPFGPTSPTTRPGRDLQRAVRERPAPPVALAQPVGPQDGGHATSCWTARKVAVNSASMLSSSSPASRALVEPALELLAQRPVRGERRVGQRPRDERPDPRPGGDEPVVLELPVGLQHRVGVDRQPRHDLLDRRELVALAQQAEPQRVPHLPHELQVRREAGARVEVEFNHSTRKIAL